MIPIWAQRILDLIDADPSKSQAGLARACGLQQGSVSGWFGKGKPTKMISGDNLITAAAYLGATPEWIMTGRNRAQPDQSQSMRLHPAMIAETHKAARVFRERQDRVYNIEAEPERFMQVYELRQQLSASPTSDELIEFGSKLAQIMTPGDESPQGAPPNGRVDGVPVTGTNEQKVARRGRSRKG